MRAFSERFETVLRPLGARRHRQTHLTYRLHLHDGDFEILVVRPNQVGPLKWRRIRFTVVNVKQLALDELEG